MAKKEMTKKEQNEKTLVDFMRRKGGKASRKEIDTELGVGFGPLVYSLIKKNIAEKVEGTKPTQFQLK